MFEKPFLRITADIYEITISKHKFITQNIVGPKLICISKVIPKDYILCNINFINIII